MAKAEKEKTKKVEKLKNEEKKTFFDSRYLFSFYKNCDFFSPQISNKEVKFFMKASFHIGEIRNLCTYCLKVVGCYIKTH